MAAAEWNVTEKRWRGALTLRFAAFGGRTVLAERLHEGPFCVQQPFYPGDGACHVYLLHPPGGLAGGDELLLDAQIETNAAVLITTPAATKFYRSEDAPSTQTQTLHVAGGASLEWLPLDTILFGGSRARIETNIHLAEGARFIGWEITSLGRPLSGDHYAAGSLTQRTRLLLEGEPLLLETLQWHAGERLLDAAWGLAGLGVCGALFAYPADERILSRVRELIGSAVPSIDDPAPLEIARDPRAQAIGATLLGRLLVVRGLSSDPEELRQAFELLWRSLRAAVVGRPTSAPRIWKT